jgi:hypothetical protein
VDGRFEGAWSLVVCGPFVPFLDRIGQHQIGGFVIPPFFLLFVLKSGFVFEFPWEISDFGWELIPEWGYFWVQL